MVNLNALKRYIEKERNKGFSDNKIKKELKNYSYSDELISVGFARLREKAPQPKKKGAILAIIITAVIILGAVYFGRSFFAGRVETPQIVPLPSESGPISLDNNETREAVNKKNYNAILNEDVSFCDSLNAPVNQIQCRDRLHTTLAYRKKNESFCDLIEGDIYGGAHPITGETDDIKICNTIVESLKRDSLDNVCNSMFENQADIILCHLSLEGKCDLCEGIKEPEIKQRCLNDCEKLPDWEPS